MAEALLVFCAFGIHAVIGLGGIVVAVKSFAALSR